MLVSKAKEIFDKVEIILNMENKRIDMKELLNMLEINYGWSMFGITYMLQVHRTKTTYVQNVINLKLLPPEQYL